MIYVNSAELLNETVTASATGTAKVLGDNVEGMIFVADFSSVGGSTPTFDLKMQHSHDGALWFDLVSFTQVTADASELKEVAITQGVMKYLRYDVVVTGAGATADIVLNAVYNLTNKDN